MRHVAMIICFHLQATDGSHRCLLGPGWTFDATTNACYAAFSAAQKSHTDAYTACKALVNSGILDSAHARWAVGRDDLGLDYVPLGDITRVGMSFSQSNLRSRAGQKQVLCRQTEAS